MIRHVVVTAAIVKNVGHVFHFVYLSVCLSVCLSVSLSVSVYLSVCLSVWRITGKVVDQL